MKSYPVQVIFREYFEGIVAAVFLAVFLRIFVLSVLYVPATNMEPGLGRGDFVLGWRLAYGFPLPLSAGDRLNQKMPLRGELVSFRFPGDQEQIIIRRIVGIPGDKVSIEEGKLILNGKAAEYQDTSDGINEKLPDEGRYHRLKSPLEGEFKTIAVPKGHFFVLSDNRSKLDDSRSWGLVPLANIESRIWWVWLSVDSSGSNMGLRWPRMFKTIY